MATELHLFCRCLVIFFLNGGGGSSSEVTRRFAASSEFRRRWSRALWQRLSDALRNLWQCSLRACSRSKNKLRAALCQA